MAEPTLLGDILAPAWNALDASQRVAWHFWAAANPQVDERARLRTMYGYQAYQTRNASIAVLETEPLLENPPTHDTAPPSIRARAIAWPIQARLATDVTARNGVAYIELDEPVPADTAVIVKQSYTRQPGRPGRPEQTRHVRIVLPLDAGPVSLQNPNGYYSQTAGVNQWSTIRGRTARRRPDKPFAVLRVVNLSNGRRVRQVLANPNAGSRRHSNRARASAVAPDSGVNHYP